ncbi:MAG: hypothetical protein LBE13_08475 [Bacteroidales bacterium]|jgi:hypothetical protein|nr:hypothetical protein [Bacteroidales bacterium]
MYKIDGLVSELQTAYWKIHKEIISLDNKYFYVLAPCNERSIMGILFHLDFHEQLYLSQYIRKMMYQLEPEFHGFKDEEEWNTHYRMTPWMQLESFRSERDRNVDLLLSGGNDILDKWGLHLKRGRTSLLDCIQRTIEHDKYHIQHIQDIKKYFLVDVNED